MKKIAVLGVMIFIFTFSFLIHVNTTEAYAKTIKINKKFASDLKKGKLPDSKGHINMTYKKLKSLESKREYYLMDGRVYKLIDGAENPTYHFEMMKGYYVTNKDIVTKIDKIYPSNSFKRSDVIKYLGKPKKISGIGNNFEAVYKYKEFTVTITSATSLYSGIFMENSVISITKNFSFNDVINTIF